jgi:hypothetical protein
VRAAGRVVDCGGESQVRRSEGQLDDPQVCSCGLQTSLCIPFELLNISWVIELTVRLVNEYFPHIWRKLLTPAKSLLYVKLIHAQPDETTSLFDLRLAIVANCVDGDQLYQ